MNPSVLRGRLQQSAHHRCRHTGLLRDRRDRLTAQPHRLQRLARVHPMLLPAQDPGAEAAAPPAATATGDGAAPDGRGQSGAEPDAT